jgi:outer membrane protein OmpA-like peptidoglycan-associated protein
MHFKSSTYLLFILPFLGFCQDQGGPWSLYFENDSYRITISQKTFIDSIQEYSLQLTDSIVLKGYASSPADSTYNLKLSERRANSVKKQFQGYTTIIANGFGELEGDEDENRRVDIMTWPVYQEKLAFKNNTASPTKLLKRINDYAKIEVGEKIELKGIHFYPGRDDIRNDSKDALNELLVFLQENETITFRLLGHVCCGKNHAPGRDGYNNRTGKNNLSEARAKRIYNYLLDNAIDKKRMSARGYAYRYPTGKGDRYDRRVEIEVISK